MLNYFVGMVVRNIWENNILWSLNVKYLQILRRNKSGERLRRKWDINPCVTLKIYDNNFSFHFTVSNNCIGSINSTDIDRTEPSFPTLGYQQLLSLMWFRYSVFEFWQQFLFSFNSFQQLHLFHKLCRHKQNSSLLSKHCDSNNGSFLSVLVSLLFLSLCFFSFLSLIFLFVLESEICFLCLSVFLSSWFCLFFESMSFHFILSWLFWFFFKFAYLMY